ncbi:cytochrome P450 [Mycobacterium vicinigordonae]|uniref:Cytochrome P450 n=1 Tax=Mycobacterium vicinigordonae TaxID=1719132 RepID=A0A7D6DZZ2_9MYCO|nr:cytochrome P450 [Mycobacterium vicinigordonae]QLL06601.1 cytochrome P450 [Mycobacterium vicinigordonae]
MSTAHIHEAPPVVWDPQNPHAYWDQRRQEGDIVWDDTMQAWLVLGYQAARDILSGPGWSSNLLSKPEIYESISPTFDPEMFNRFILFADGVNHIRLRKAVRDVFTRSFIAGMRTGVQAIGSALIGHPEPHTVFDFMTEIALPMPVAIIGEWLRLDTNASRFLNDQAPTIIRMLQSLADPEEVARGTAAFSSIFMDFLPLAADRRTHPGDDLLSLIASDPDLELDDVVITAILIAVASRETTANLLGAAIVRLLTPEPDGARIIDDVDPADPSLVTELFRLDASVQTAARTATQDHAICGVDIAQGQQVVVVIPAVNRDPAVFDEPSRFRWNRSGPAPLTFSHGAHYCLGAALARLEITVALEEISARKPSLAGPPIWGDTQAIRGPQSVPMIFDR